MSIVIYITNKIISTHLLPHYVGVIGCLVELENWIQSFDCFGSSLCPCLCCSGHNKLRLVVHGLLCRCHITKSRNAFDAIYFSWSPVATPLSLSIRPSSCHIGRHDRCSLPWGVYRSCWLIVRYSLKSYELEGGRAAGFTPCGYVITRIGCCTKGEYAIICVPGNIPWTPGACQFCKASCAC